MTQPVTIKERLEKILGTIVSQDIINHLNQKEGEKLFYTIKDCELSTLMNKPDIYGDDIDECIETIKSILDNGKSRIKSYRDIPKVKEYLKIKQL